LTPNSIEYIFLLWVVDMCDIVTLGGKGNVLEPGNHISVLMSSALDLGREHLPPMGSPYV
jgi:hypothetical protein